MPYSRDQGSNWEWQFHAKWLRDLITGGQKKHKKATLKLQKTLKGRAFPAKEDWPEEKQSASLFKQTGTDLKRTKVMLLFL